MSKRLGGFTKLALVAAVGLIGVPRASAAVVINEVYGGGGNAGSTYRNDFIELYNNGATPADISGYQLDYASASGAATSPFGTDDNFSTIVPSGTTLTAGGFYLIQESAGTGGTTALPSPNQADTIAIGASGFKIYLYDSTGAQADLVGAGTANAYEGAGAAPAPSNTTSVQRIADGVDTNNNNLDFGAAAPTPGAPNAVPEPASLGMVAGGIALVALRRRRSRANA